MINRKARKLLRYRLGRRPKKGEPKSKPNRQIHNLEDSSDIDPEDATSTRKLPSLEELKNLRRWPKELQMRILKARSRKKPLGWKELAELTNRTIKAIMSMVRNQYPSYYGRKCNNGARTGWNRKDVAYVLEAYAKKTPWNIIEKKVGKTHGAIRKMLEDFQDLDEYSDDIIAERLAARAARNPGEDITQEQKDTIRDMCANHATFEEVRARVGISIRRLRLYTNEHHPNAFKRVAKPARDPDTPHWNTKAITQEQKDLIHKMCADNATLNQIPAKVHKAARIVML